ncbi:hypothetical protein DFH08DRAFT_953299 [Mycena albidolilacea]|uniref:Uncharacterized protein n=1 Tax=Mycena albidolilacea TaxID=1033008 RepID=A0AAD7AGE3_9AGAR|nr:hypothetical protein DFH08DRAFT_953299 [Mycena albidolilacea]
MNLAAQNTHSSAFDTDDSFEEDADTGQEDKVFTHRSAYFSADGVYDYLGGPDLEFGPTLEPWGRRGSTSTGTEIREIETEGAPSSPLRSRSKSRSKSRSRSYTPLPAILSSSPNGASGVGVSVSPGAASPRSPAGSLLSPPPRGHGSSQSPTSSSVSQGRSCSAMRTSSSSLSDRERSRSSHTSPLGSLSREYGGVHISADYGSGGYAYAGLVKRGREREPGEGRAPASVCGEGRDGVAGGGRLNVEFGVERGDGDAPMGGGERRADGGGVRNPQTPANSPVVHILRERLFVSPAHSIVSATSSSGSMASATPPGSQTTTPQPPKSAVSSSKSTLSPKKPTSPMSKSIPISPPRTQPVNGALPIEEEVPQYEYGSVPEETDEARPRPRTRPSCVGAPTKPAQSMAKSIPGSKPAAAGKPPVSPARATFQTSVAVPTAASAGPRMHARLRLSVGVIACGSSSITYRHWVWSVCSAAVRAAMRVPRLRFACHCYGA